MTGVTRDNLGHRQSRLADRKRPQQRLPSRAKLAHAHLLSTSSRTCYSSSNIRYQYF